MSTVHASPNKATISQKDGFYLLIMFSELIRLNGANIHPTGVIFTFLFIEAHCKYSPVKNSDILTNYVKKCSFEGGKSIPYTDADGK